MKTLIRTKPLYFLLLSIFFVFHGYIENYDLIPIKEASVLLAFYIVVSFVLACIFLLLYRNISKAALIAFLLMAFYFFFGAIYDSLISIAPRSYLSKYSVILGVFLFISLICIIFLFRYRKPLTKWNYVLNVFFCFLLLVDSGWLVYKVVNRRSFSDSAFQGQIQACDTCSKPDIYLILMDEYAGDQALLETMNFDNGEFKDQLRQRGFHTPRSISNYNFTPFSIASMLEMDYLEGLEGKNTSHSDLAMCYELIRENNLFQFLNFHGYQLRNYSIFDIYDQPSLVKNSILPEKTRFITAQTLFRRLDNNLIFNMAEKFGAGAKKRRVMLTYNSNVKALDSLNRIIKTVSSSPKFVYSHLVMPHFPYYFDKDGNYRDFPDMKSIQQRNLNFYVEYLQYANKILLKLIDEILQNSSKPPIIVLVSDHGFREYPAEVDRKYNFMNTLSVYLPGKNYNAVYDGISNVNLFRVLLNQEFKQNFPILKDSTSFILP